MKNGDIVEQTIPECFTYEKKKLGPIIFCFSNLKYFIIKKSLKLCDCYNSTLLP